MQKVRKITYPKCGLTVYTDGGVINNGMPNAYGAYGYVILKDDTILHEYAEFRIGITNNQSEMTAIVESLNWIEQNGFADQSVLLLSDSLYCVNGINHWVKKWKTNNWNNNTVANKDLWVQMQSASSRLNVTFMHVKGHNGNEWNEYVDMLCSNMIEEMKTLYPPIL